MDTMSPALLLDLLSGRGLGVEYQPLIRLADEQVLGYEAVSRFRDLYGKVVDPGRVFSALHESPLSLFQMEFQMTQLQLFLAPAGARLFINIDPDAFNVFADQPSHPLVELLAKAGNCVVEIIENSSLTDAEVSCAMQQAFGERNIALALDDVGARNSLLSFEVMSGAQYIKLSCDWLIHPLNRETREILGGIIRFAHAGERLVILEGVETVEHLEIARSLDVDAVQGFLYRDRFVECWSSEPQEHWRNTIFER